MIELWDCETVGIPPLMSRKTLGILDGGRGGAVDRLWRRRGIRGVDKGGASTIAGCMLLARRATNHIVAVENIMFNTNSLKYWCHNGNSVMQIQVITQVCIF